jgi:hypothetical protein
MMATELVVIVSTIIASSALHWHGCRSYSVVFILRSAPFALRKITENVLKSRILVTLCCRSVSENLIVHKK